MSMDSLVGFAAGLAAGAVLASLVWSRCYANLAAQAFRRILHEQGYTIRDGRITARESHADL